MAPASSRLRPDSHGNGVALPPEDAVYEILLRLPAKDLCRFRAVCRNWARLISAPHFIAAHAARHPDPLIVAGYNTCRHLDDTICDVMDLAGHIVKRIPTASDDVAEPWVTCAELGVICTTEGTGKRVQLHVLATGLVSTLPEELAEEHTAQQRSICNPRNGLDLPVFGQVAATGEYKLLRVFHYYSYHENYCCVKRMYEVLTLDDDRLDSTHARWRGKKEPPEAISPGPWTIVVVNGVVYFLSGELIWSQDAARDRVIPFDLETEEWRAALRGPLNSHAEVHGTPCPDSGEIVEVSICSMNGVLAMAYRKSTPYMDLWFLMDSQKGLWVKHHCIQLLPFSIRNYEYTIRPLWVLNDGRIVLVYVGHLGGTLRIYNPRSSTSVDVAEIGPCSAVGVYTGSLLSLTNGSS